MSDGRLEAGETLVVRRRIGAAHPAFDGHFPGRPVLPGVAVIAEVMEALRGAPHLAARVGEAPRLAVAKFVHAVLPETTIRVAVRDGAGVVAFEVSIDDDAAGDAATRRIVASGEFAVDPTGGRR